VRTSLSDFLYRYNACATSLYWAELNSITTLECAWRHCPSGEWLLWGLEQVHAPIDTTYSIAILLLESHFQSPCYVKYADAAKSWLVGTSNHIELEQALLHLQKERFPYVNADLHHAWVRLLKGLLDSTASDIDGVVRRFLRTLPESIQHDTNKQLADAVRYYVPWSDVVALLNTANIH